MMEQETRHLFDRVCERLYALEHPDDERTKPAWIGNDIAAHLRVSEKVRPLQQLHATLSAMRDSAVSEARYDLAANLRDARDEVGKLIAVAKEPLRGGAEPDDDRTTLAKEIRDIFGLGEKLWEKESLKAADLCILRGKRAEHRRLETLFNKPGLGPTVEDHIHAMQGELESEISALEKERNRDD